MAERKRLKKVAVFIDGSNFYFKIKTLTDKKTNFLTYDYMGLIKELAGKNTKIVYAGYYIGVVRDRDGSEKSLELRKKQQMLFDQLKLQGFTVVNGFLMSQKGRYYEKGVDVRLAIDMVSGAYDKIYDEALLISSDTDLLPAVIKARARDRDVQYVGFSHQPSIALIRGSTTTRLLHEDDILKYALKQRKKLIIKSFDEV